MGEEGAATSWVQRWLEQPTLTGGWFGLRDTLGGWGITPSIAYAADLLANPIGGQRRGQAYASDFSVAVDFDLAKIVGLRGLSAQVAGDWAAGSNLSDDIGNFFQVAQYFEGDRLRLASLFLRQTFLDGRLDLKAGRFATGDDFLTSPLGINLVNEALNPILFAVQANVPGVTAYPNSTWGGRVIAQPAEAVSLLAGAYYSDPFLDQLEASGTEFAINPRAGYFVVGKAVLRLNAGEGASGLPGRYRVGAYYDSNLYTSLAEPGASGARQLWVLPARRADGDSRGWAGDGTGPVPLRRLRLGAAPAHQHLALLRVGRGELPGAPSLARQGYGGVRRLLRRLQPRPPGPEP